MRRTLVAVTALLVMLSGRAPAQALDNDIGNSFLPPPALSPSALNNRFNTEADSPLFDVEGRHNVTTAHDALFIVDERSARPQ